MEPLDILIVDDEPTVLHSCRRVLERAGHRVQALDCVHSTLELCKEQNFDVALTDIMMPEMSGLEFIDRLKQLVPDAAIVVMTGYGTREIADQVRRRGASGLLLKPFTPSELRSGLADAVAGDKPVEPSASQLVA